MDVLLPVGISFYTFQTLSYVVDVYRREIPAERNFGVYALFVSFFPQLVAGPIERTRNLLPQLMAERRFNYDQAVYGMRLMAWGFYKKLVIADNLAIYADKVFNNPEDFAGFAVLIAMACFTFQIYCDFSAYSDIARGTAKLLGIELMENFKSPYLSASIKEFWSRWHISLSTWFRDYVYIPLGGNRVSRWRHRWNLLVTFLLSGLWHGANWTFLVWGGLHGLAQVIENSVVKKTGRDGGHKTGRIAFHIMRVCLVFLFAMFAWTFFRANNLKESFILLNRIPDGITLPIAYLHDGFSSLGLSRSMLAQLTFFILLLCLYDAASLKTDCIARLAKCPAAVRWTVSFALILIIVMFAPASTTSQFIYFQF